jgi:putative peptidoglycan lipid II flippase|tara:strand:+ start:3833 stop:5104 length:1272 start_codon:yes stop_codon:yes gene_type:complete
MHLKNFFGSQLLKDFSNLFFANIFQKVLGLIRELVIAFFLGSSILYANFLLLRIVADFFSQITAGNALKANLLPKFTKLYEKNKEVSLKEVFRFSQQSSVYLFIISQVIQTAVIFYLNLESNLLFFGVSLVLSFSICFNFINTIFLTVFQARGLFLRYSYASVTNSLVFTLLVYPLISFVSVIGLALSRLAAILSVYFSFVRPLKKENTGFEVRLNHSDFNFPTLILGNFANIIIISSRFVAGTDGSNSITFFMYAVVLLNALMTAVIGNVSTILLRKIAIKKNTKLMIYSLLTSVFVGLLMVVGLYFYSAEVVKFVYLRGAFNIADVQQTSAYLYELSFAFLLLFVSTILFQPYLTLSIEQTRKERLGMVVLFLLSIAFSVIFAQINSFTSKEGAFLMMYISSTITVALSGYSYFKYIQYGR